MRSPLMVFVADPYRTQSSCAVLGYLRQRERRRGGRSVQFVFDPTDVFAPGLMSGAEGAVLVLLEGQKAAAEKLLRFWETLKREQARPVPVLPVLIQGSSQTGAGSEWSVSPLVTVAESDILVEHGGHLSLTESAETNIEQALSAVLQTGLRSTDIKPRPINASCRRHLGPGR